MRSRLALFSVLSTLCPLDGKAPGPGSRLNDVQRQALVDVVESGPIPAIHGVVRWRLIWPVAP
jgi:hypothetical protein